MPDLSRDFAEWVEERHRRLTEYEGTFGHAVHFDREGDPITLEQWVFLHEDFDYRVVTQTRLVPEDVLISTVWLGLNHNFFDDELPIIFETMVFGCPAFEDEQWRYPFEGMALVGHEAVVRDVLAVVRRRSRVPLWVGPVGVMVAGLVGGLLGG